MTIFESVSFAEDQRDAQELLAKGLERAGFENEESGRLAQTITDFLAGHPKSCARGEGRVCLEQGGAETEILFNLGPGPSPQKGSLVIEPEKQLSLYLPGSQVSASTLPDCRIEEEGQPTIWTRKDILILDTSTGSFALQRRRLLGQITINR